MWYRKRKIALVARYVILLSPDLDPFLIPVFRNRFPHAARGTRIRSFRRNCKIRRCSKRESKRDRLPNSRARMTFTALRPRVPRASHAKRMGARAAAIVPPQVPLHTRKEKKENTAAKHFYIETSYFQSLPALFFSFAY